MYNYRGFCHLKKTKITKIKLGMLRVLTESGIEFQMDPPILVKDFFSSGEFDRETFFCR